MTTCINSLIQWFYWFYNVTDFVTLVIRLPEDDANALKHTEEYLQHKIYCYYICCALVGVNNKLYKMHSTDIKMSQNVTNELLKDHSIFIFRIKQSKQIIRLCCLTFMMVLQSFKTSWITCPVTWHHIPEDLNL